MARLGNDDREKVIINMKNILLALNDMFQDDASEASASTSEGSSVSITFCNLEKQYAKVRKFLSSQSVSLREINKNIGDVLLEMNVANENCEITERCMLWKDIQWKIFIRLYIRQI